MPATQQSYDMLAKVRSLSTASCFVTSDRLLSLWLGRHSRALCPYELA